MEWFWIIVVAGIALYLWTYWRSRKVFTAPPASTPLGLNMASDRELMFNTFRRELANYLVRRDPDRFLHLYHKARGAETEIENGEKAVREAQFTILSNKYQFYTDFDLIGIRDHVLYADALGNYATEDIEEHYLNLVKFQALQIALNPDWKYRAAATSDKSLEHLREYVRKIKDTRFRQRLVAAVDEFYTHRSSNRSTDPDQWSPAYETKMVAVYYVPHIAENRFGFHFKDTDEFGLYGSFSNDGDKFYQSFYRSDRLFKSENYLDYLRIDEPM